ncbi:MAG TPA: glycosyltransferase [Rudaea sp.]|jgi:GT2 family glycosyltransferase|nr:glycosyltransferase [Rudaea sp.]
MPNSPAILVLGMHRSGTSALTRVLGLMGADVGAAETLLPAHATDNPAGYWERAELNTIHDELLAITGHRWDKLSGFDSTLPDDESTERALEHLRRFIRQTQMSGKPWVAKDPRLSLFLPRWSALIGDAACVVAVRDPRDIAASMSSGPRGTFTSAFVIALWEKYLTTLLRDLNGHRALFVSYDALLADSVSQCERVRGGLRDLGVDGLTMPSPDELHSFLDTNLRRSVAKPHVVLSPSQERVSQWLDDQCKSAGPVDVRNVSGASENLDAILAEFEAAFAYHIEHGRVVGNTESMQRIERIEAMLAAQAQERERWLAEIARQQRSLIESQDHATALATRLASNEQALSHATRELSETTADRDAFQRHAASLEESVRALRGSLSWKITAPLRAVAGLFHRRNPSRGAEQRLYRIYYAIPGFTPARKRALVLWIHRHMPWLTRRTLSYRLYAQTQALLSRRKLTPEERQRAQRMTESRAKELLASIDDPPLISIVMPVYNVERKWLMAAVDSVRRQFYPHWELCIADDASPREETRLALKEIEAFGDARIKIRRLEANLGIGGASNAALDIATGTYVGLLDNDDELTRDALLEVALRIKSDDPDLVYSDEDKLDEDGNHVEPYFKSDYSPDYLLCNNYICHFSVIRRQLFVDAGAFQPGFDGAQDFDLMLRVCERAKTIVHIPKILYHWRKVPGSTAATSAGKPYTHEAGKRAVAAALQRRGVSGESQSGPFPNTYRARREIVGQPLVSILIPFRDKHALLDACVTSILDKTDYPNFEIVGLDNASAEPATHRLMERLSQCDARVRFVRHDAPFNFSAINNAGAAQAHGEHLVFLNNDTEVISGQWLRAMLEHSQRDEVGVVGAKLLYSDNTIQHAGVILGLGGMAGHSHLMQPAHHHGYFSRPQLVQNLSAVTFACAMTRTSVFEQLHGLNETELAVAFNDVDYCLRAREAGYLVVYTPYAELYHHESKSRGYETDRSKRDRLARETAFMQQRHGDVLNKGDPYYNPNLSLTNNFEPDPHYADGLPL